MAGPTRREKHDWEAQMASVSLAGIRPLVSSSVSVGAASTGTYTVSGNQMTKRLVLFHDSGNNLEIRVDVNNTASSSSFPVATGLYFVLEVEEADDVSLYNGGAGTTVVYVAEIR